MDDNKKERNLHYWIKHNDWDRLKRAAADLPSLVVENCYHLLSQLTRSYIHEFRTTKPLTKDEAETMYRLTLTIQKLKNRSTLNESMEMFALLQDGINKKNPALAKELRPFIENYISSRADKYISEVMPENFTPSGYLGYEEPEPISEIQQDHIDRWEWECEAYEKAHPVGPLNEELMKELDRDVPPEKM